MTVSRGAYSAVPRHGSAFRHAQPSVEVSQGEADTAIPIKLKTLATNHAALEQAGTGVSGVSAKFKE